MVFFCLFVFFFAGPRWIAADTAPRGIDPCKWDTRRIWQMQIRFLNCLSQRKNTTHSCAQKRQLFKEEKEKSCGIPEWGSKSDNMQEHWFANTVEKGMWHILSSKWGHSEKKMIFPCAECDLHHAVSSRALKPWWSSWQFCVLSFPPGQTGPGQSKKCV